MVLYNGSIGRVSGCHSPPCRLPDGFTKITDTRDHQQGAQNLQKVERRWRGESRRGEVNGKEKRDEGDRGGIQKVGYKDEGNSMND